MKTKHPFHVNSLLITTFCILFSSFIIVSNAQIITTVAGNGTSGFSGDGGQATAAEFKGPSSIWFYNGNFYIADFGNERVRIIDPTGVVDIYAGTGVGGYSGNGGQATAANFNQPSYIMSDYSDNIIIDDENNHRYRMVSTSGIVSLIAGNGVAGFSGDGGQATAAEVNNTEGGISVLDDTGNIYIADNLNHRVRKISTSGIITTIAGNGTSGYSGDGGQATAAELKNPYGVAVDDAGNIYIGDYGDSRIRKINTSGVISTFAGTGGCCFSGDGGQASAAAIEEPIDLLIDDNNNLYFTEAGNNDIRKVNISSGIISLVAGNRHSGFSGDGGQATAAEFGDPRGMDMDDDGNLYIADQTNNRIREIYLVLDVSATVTANVSCHGGSNGTVTSTVSHGTTPYTYSWYPGSPNTSTITGLSAGTYTLTVTDNVGVTGTASFTITQPTALSVSANTTANVSCNGGSNGSATVAVSGGTSPYTYSWTGGSTTATETGLSAGTYTVTVTDICGATATASATITQPTVLSVSDTVTANVSCYAGSNGSVSATPSAGTSPYTYAWASGGTNSTYTGLTAGTYSITVTDNCGATATASAIITQPATALSVSVTAQSPSYCFGYYDSLTTIVTGGTPPFTYSWSPISGLSCTICQSIMDTTLISNTYILTVTDNNGCISTTSVSITVNPTPTVTISSTSDSIPWGQFDTLSATGAVSYLWNNGETTSTIIVNPEVSTMYSVIGTGTNGCTGTASMIVYRIAGSLCYAGVCGDVEVNANGLSPYFTITTTHADDIILIFYNGIEINWPWATGPGYVAVNSHTATFLGINNGNSGGPSVGVYAYDAPAIGTYTVYCNPTIYPSPFYESYAAAFYACENTCEKLTINNIYTNFTRPILGVTSGTVSNTFHIYTPNSVIFSDFEQITGQSSPFTYTWTPSTVCLSQNIQPSIVDFNSSVIISGVSTPGNTTISCHNNAVDSRPVQSLMLENVVIAPPPCFQFTPTVVQPSFSPCSSGSISVSNNNVLGGTPPYNYYWSNGLTTSSATGLSAGTYTITVTDPSGGCSYSVAVTITSPVTII